MSQTIQCPTCAKNFKLPERPPATFTCTGCQTVMDLSGFRAAAPAAPAAAAPSTPNVGHKRPGAAAARLRVRARKGADDEGDDDEGGRGRGAPAKKDNNALVIGSLIGFVVIIGIAFIVLRKKKDEPAKPTTTALVPPGGGAALVPTTAAPGMAADPAMATDAAMAADAAMGTEPGMEGDKPAEPAKYVSPKNVTYHVIEHHPDATPEEREKIDALIQKAVFENAGADSRTAGNELVAMGVKAAPRLINVFSTVKMGEGFTDPMGRIKCAVAENLLRRIDGYIERKVGPKNTPLKGQSDPVWVERCTRHWISWWDSEKYKTPEKPWDERIDGNRDDAPEKGAAGMDAPDAGK